MEAPKRYDLVVHEGGGYMDEEEDGDYVEYGDYAALCEKLAAKDKEIERALRICGRNRHAAVRIAMVVSVLDAALDGGEK